MKSRISQPVARFALLLALLVPGLAQAQYRSPSQPSEPDQTYGPQPHPKEDAVAIAFLSGRYATPLTCKRSDGTSFDLQQSIVFKEAPEEGGGDIIKATFFGVDVSDVAYCYNLIERRVVDRRGTILLHFRSHNRADLGISDFRRALMAGPLTYNAHEGSLTERGIGTDPEFGETKTLSFDGGDSRVVLDVVPNGSDGAKLLAGFEVPSTAVQPTAKDMPKRFSFHFYAKDGSDFVVYAVEEVRKRR